MFYQLCASFIKYQAKLDACVLPTLERMPHEYDSKIIIHKIATQVPYEYACMLLHSCVYSNEFSITLRSDVHRMHQGRRRCMHVYFYLIMKLIGSTYMCFDARDLVPYLCTEWPAHAEFLYACIYICCIVYIMKQVTFPPPPPPPPPLVFQNALGICVTLFGTV